MSNIKINEELFLGKQELNRLMKFLVDDGYKLWFGKNVEQYGIVNRINKDSSFENLKIVVGSTPSKVTLKAGLAIDSNLDFIYNETDAVDVLNIPTDNVYRDITITFNSTNIEKGTLSVAANGQITGVGTFFTEVLRGQPNFPVRIKFPNATINTGEYEVVSVSNDTDALLSGQFTIENDLEYIVVGTFTPDKPIPAPSKDIYNYDSYTLNLGGTPVAGTEFYLARVRTDGLIMEIQDHRGEFFQTKADWDLKDFDRTSSPLAGLEWEKYDTEISDKSENIFRLGFGFRASFGNYGVDWNARQVTITAGEGGIFKSTLDFTDNDFDGWRIYFLETGHYEVIETSTIAGSTITLALRYYEIGRLPSAPIGDIAIVPNCDKVEIRSSNQSVYPIIDTYAISHVANGYVDFKQKLLTVAGFSQKIEYRYVWGKETSAWNDMNVGDYYAPSAFNVYGVLTGTDIKTSLLGGIISVTDFDDPTHEARLIAIEGDTTYARRNEVNEFTKRQTFQGGLFAAIDVDKFDLELGGTQIDGGNQFTVVGSTGQTINYMTDYPVGTKIVLTFSGTGAGANFINHNAGAPPVGYAPFYFNSNTSITNLDLSGGSTYVFEKTTAGWMPVNNALLEENQRLNSSWIDIPIDLKQTSTTNGDYTAIGVDAEFVQNITSLPTTYAKYKVNGSIVTINFRFMGVRFKTFNTLPSLCLILDGLPASLSPTYAVETTGLALCTNFDDCLSGVPANIAINTGGDKLVVRLERKTTTADYAYWNRTYELSASPSLVVIEQAGSGNIFADWEVRGSITYEI